MTVEQYIPNDKPNAPKKSANSNESQTTTLDIPSKMIEEQHNEVVNATNETNRAAKVGFVSLGCQRVT
jgi:ribosomal protein S12 methylthiotransferase